MCRNFICAIVQFEHLQFGKSPFLLDGATIQISILENMKYFQISQKNFSRLGIASKQSKRSHNRLMFTWLIFGVGDITCVLFFVLKANSFIEYIVSIYTTTALLILSIFFAILSAKREELFKFITNFDIFINESE